MYKMHTVLENGKHKSGSITDTEVFRHTGAL